jgi:hypothetical protein
VTVKGGGEKRWDTAILALICGSVKIVVMSRIGWKDRFGFAAESA